MNETTTTKTIVSPDVMGHDETAHSMTVGHHRVILVPMEEWKQCAVRAFRSFVQAAGFLLGGGTIVQFAGGYGIPPAMVLNMPSTGNAPADAILYAALFGLIIFVWNFVEFWLDIDVKWPGFRA